MIRKRMTRRQTLQVLVTLAQEAEKQFDACLASQGLDRTSDAMRYSFGTQLAACEFRAYRRALHAVLTADTDSRLPGVEVEWLLDGSRTVAELLERYAR